MAAELFRILYCSRNTMDPASSTAELAEILAAARRNNHERGVTGALLYNAGIFAQTLEGTFEAVQSIFEQIQVDHRHADVVVLEAQTVNARLFGEWAMAFAEPADPVGTNAVLSKALLEHHRGNCNGILALLDQVVRRDTARSLACV